MLKNTFQSIKFRFVLIYFVLVLICMSIVGSFIIQRLEVIQREKVEENMKKTISSISTAVSATIKGGEDNYIFLDKNLKNWGLTSSQNVYILSSGDNPKVISTSLNSDENLRGKSAYSLAFLESSLLTDASKGREEERIVLNKSQNLYSKHIASPILSNEGNVIAIVYMTENLNSIYELIGEAKIIISYATVISLLITSILGYFIANSITTPIRDVTRKAREMAKGNFDQRVDVKSNDEIGQLGNMFNYLTDELKNTIAKNDLERSKLNTIFNYMAEGVIAVDRTNKLIHANSIAKNLLSLDDSRINTQINLKKIGLKDINYDIEKSLQGEVLAEIKNHFYKLKYAPYKSDLKENEGLIIVLSDINKEHRLDILRKEFVANVSHELKTPITTIGSYAETLLNGVAGEDINHFLKVIERENARMARLVSDLLVLSNIDYKKEHLNKESFDCYEFIEEAVESQSLLISQKSHNISIDVPIKIRTIYSDRHGASQILINIISNALKYTKEGGKILIAAENYKNGKNNFVKISVKDNGIGIPKEDLPMIFERFYRVEKGRSREMGGTGLGLSIANEMIKSLGGSIKISSTLNVGTDVELFFPAGDYYEFK